MKIQKTLSVIIASIPLLIGACNPLNDCTKVTNVPIVDDFQAETLLQTYRSTICDKSDGSFDVYRNGRLMYSVK